MVRITSAVAVPMVSPQWINREGVHSKCAWWLFGMCSWMVVWRYAAELRTCEVTRLPFRNSSIVVAV